MFWMLPPTRKAPAPKVVDDPWVQEELIFPPLPDSKTKPEFYMAVDPVSVEFYKRHTPTCIEFYTTKH